MVENEQPNPIEAIHEEWERKSESLQAMKNELQELCIDRFGMQGGYVKAFRFFRDSVNQLYKLGLTPDDTAKKVARYILLGGTAEYGAEYGCDAFDFDPPNSMVDYLFMILTKLRNNEPTPDHIYLSTQ